MRLLEQGVVASPYRAHSFSKTGQRLLFVGTRTEPHGEKTPDGRPPESRLPEQTPDVFFEEPVAVDQEKPGVASRITAATG
jgi:hypothetical protein